MLPGIWVAIEAALTTDERDTITRVCVERNPWLEGAPVHDILAIAYDGDGCAEWTDPFYEATAPREFQPDALAAGILTAAILAQREPTRHEASTICARILAEWNENPQGLKMVAP